MKPFVKAALNFLLFLCMALLCFLLFHTPTAFLGGYIGALTGDYLTHKFEKKNS